MCSILGRIIRVTDEVIDYRRWIKETFLLPVSEADSLSSSTGSDASTLSAPASDTVNIVRKYIFKYFSSIGLIFSITWINMNNSSKLNVRCPIMQYPFDSKFISLCFLRIPSAVGGILRTLVGKTRMKRTKTGISITVNKCIIIQERKHSKQPFTVWQLSDSMRRLCVLQSHCNRSR